VSVLAPICSGLAAAAAALGIVNTVRGAPIVFAKSIARGLRDDRLRRCFWATAVYEGVFGLLLITFFAVTASDFLRQVGALS